MLAGALQCKAQKNIDKLLALPAKQGGRATFLIHAHSEDRGLRKGKGGRICGISRERFTFTVPVGVVAEWVDKALLPSLWKVERQGPGCLTAEEKMFPDGPYDKRTFIGPARVEIRIESTLGGTVVDCHGSNKYYGDDPPPKRPGDLANGHAYSEQQISLVVGGLGAGLSASHKEWSARQRYERAQEGQKAGVRQAVPPPPAPVATPRPPNAPVSIIPEQLTIEAFVAQLERVAALHRDGSLTGPEFERAKLLLLKATD